MHIYFNSNVVAIYMTDDYRLDGNQEEISTEVTDLMHLCNCKRCCSLFRALVKYVICHT